VRSRRSWFDIADAAMLAVVVIWAANTVFVKAVLDEVSPMAYVVARFAIVVLLLFAWLAWRHQLQLPARTDWPLIGLSGLSGYAIYQALFTVGLCHTSAFSVSLLLSLGPVLTMLFAVALGMERVRARQWLGALIATAGVVLFVGESISRGLARLDCERGSAQSAGSGGIRRL